MFQWCKCIGLRQKVDLFNNFCILVYKYTSLIIVNNDLRKNILEIIGESVKILLPIIGRCTSKGIFIRREDLTLNISTKIILSLRSFV